MPEGKVIEFRLRREKPSWRSIGATLIAAFVSIRACADIQELRFDKDDAIQIAKEREYEDVRVSDVDKWLVPFQGCASGDVLGFDIAAENQAGQPVNLKVCVGAYGELSLRE